MTRASSASLEVRCSMTGEPTVRILDEMRAQLSASVDAANARVDRLRHELDGRVDEPSRRLIESETGTAAAIGDLACAVRELVTAVCEQVVTSHDHRS